jgi:hypothetical protein
VKASFYPYSELGLIHETPELIIEIAAVVLFSAFVSPGKIFSSPVSLQFAIPNP